MSDIIGRWLTETLGIIIEVYSETFVRLIQNGYLVGAILRHYNVITADQLTYLTSIGDTGNPIDKVSHWLKLVNIHLNDDDKNHLLKGKISKALELLYELYLIFHGKDLVHFTAKQLETEKLREGNDRFKVTPVKEDLQDISNVAPHRLSWILSDYRHVIQWYTDRYQQLVRRCEQLRANYEFYMTNRVPTQLSRLKPAEHFEKDDELLNEDDVKSLHETYDELIEQERKVLTQGSFIPDAKKTKKIVKDIKKKFDKERVDVLFQTKMETMVLAEFWNEILRTQSKRLEANISEKMLKQSYYEKQMMNKLFELRERKEIMAENRITIQTEIQKKRDSEYLDAIFNQRKDMAGERYRYYFERDRVLELHRRIYNEKQRLKSQRALDMCKTIVEDLINLAFRRAEYKRDYEEEMSRSMLADMAALFVSSKTMLDLLPVAEIIVENDPANEVEEEIYLNEIDRQNTIDDMSLENYCTFTWPWDLNERLPDYKKLYPLHSIDMAMNVLGHIVFRLLLAKYPKPSPKRPPNIPKVQIAVAINNISDLTIIPILRKLLSEREIKVVQIPEVINYCLSMYKDETTEEYQESQFFDETEDALQKVEQKKNGKKAKSEKGKEVKQKGEKKGIKKIPIQEHIESCDPIAYQEKQVQTPKTFPGADPTLSSAAKLGKIAYEILQLGEGLNDALVVQMFVEYLKGLKNINGWCLINYPSTLAQSILLEEALTAKTVPLNLEVPKNKSSQDLVTEIKNPSVPFNDIKSTDSFGLGALFSSQRSNIHSGTDKTNQDGQIDCEVNQEEDIDNYNNPIEDIADLQYREVKQNIIVDDPNTQYRTSRILKNPDLPETIEDYNCYLTSFIRLIQDVPSQEKLSATIALDDLDRFYQSQGCLYCLYYKIFDLATIKHIGKLIIGDYSIPPKSSVQIFGDMVLYLENDLNQGSPTLGKVSVNKFGGSKKEKPAKSPQRKPVSTKSAGTPDKREKPAKNDKGGKKNKKEEPNVLIFKADKETQIPEEPAEYEVITLPEQPPSPGQTNWKYVDLPIPEFFEIALATLWENVEEVYVCDFKELFFRRRTLWYTVMPYLTFVKRYMRDFIDRPDNKQIHLYNFQRVYNEIAEDMRDDNEVKAELHCRINEFEEKMFQICDTRMNEAENERQTIITQDWTSKQTCELTNVSITILQLEIDRCVDTLQLLNDYYVSMITKMPCPDDVMQKIMLEYITFNDKFEFENLHVYSKFVRNVLTQGDAITNDSPFHKVMNNNHSEAMRAAEHYKQTSMNILSNMEAYFQPKGKKGTTAKREIKGKGKALPKFSAPEPAVKDVGLKLIEEWRCAVEGEYARVCLRLDLILAEAYEDLSNMLVESVKIFHALYEEIKDRYDKEIDSIQKCCDILCRAVEEEMAIQPELVLKGDKFYVNPDVLLFEDSLPEPEPILKEYEAPGIFTIVQLSDLTSILLDLAPKGIMPERAFTFLLQDLIVYNADDGRPSVVPPLWTQLPLRNVNKLSYEFFGHVELVDWKDFIIYNLCVEFPDELQLMQTRKQFRDFDVDANEYVYDYQFYAIKFWFESEFNQENAQEALRLREIKKLLFKLFKISMDRVNYTALLLTFCKNSEGYLGLAKALALSLGKVVCWDIEIGKKFSTILRQRQLEQLQDKIRLELEEAAKVETVDEVIDDLIDVTVHQCDSVCLESYHSDKTHTAEEDIGNKEEVVDPELAYLENLMKEYENSYHLPCEEEPQFFLQEEFANVEIGYEPEFYPSKVYYLSLDVLLTVVMAAMPWEAVSKNNDEVSLRQLLEETYNKCKNEEFEGVVLMHEFLNNETVKEIFERTNKFIARKPLQILNKLLDR